jgi:hypothetical protein
MQAKSFCLLLLSSLCFETSSVSGKAFSYAVLRESFIYKEMLLKEETNSNRYSEIFRYDLNAFNHQSYALLLHPKQHWYCILYLCITNLKT